jgi:MFS family permease
VIAIGECFHTAVLMPLAADLAPESVRGRYLALLGLSWWLGLAAGPTVGTQLLSRSATVTFVACAVAAGGAALSLLALDRRLPATARLTPRPPARDA